MVYELAGCGRKNEQQKMNLLLREDEKMTTAMSTREGYLTKAKFLNAIVCSSRQKGILQVQQQLEKGLINDFDTFMLQQRGNKNGRRSPPLTRAVVTELYVGQRNLRVANTTICVTFLRASSIPGLAKLEKGSTFFERVFRVDDRNATTVRLIFYYVQSMLQQLKEDNRIFPKHCDSTHARQFH